MASSLKTDFQCYLDHQEEFLRKHNGKVLVIKDCQIVFLWLRLCRVVPLSPIFLFSCDGSLETTAKDVANEEDEVPHSPFGIRHFGCGPLAALCSLRSLW